MSAINEFNKFEHEIIEICSRQRVDYDRIDFLLKNGASVNACIVTKYSSDDIEEDLLLVECWRNANFLSDDNERKIDDDFYLRLLKIFIDNGLDVDKYANVLLSNIQYTYNNKYYIELVKVILNNLRGGRKLNFDESLDAIGSEESYQNCCMQDHEYANTLSTIYEMIEKFSEKGLDPNKYYGHNRIIDQKIKDTKIFCKDVKIDQPRKFICDEIEIFIECEFDTLCIINKFIFVNNNKIESDHEPLAATNRINSENFFGNSLKEYTQNEKIIKIEFNDLSIKSAPKTTIHCTVITVKLTNNKIMKIGTDETASFMKITLK